MMAIELSSVRNQSINFIWTLDINEAEKAGYKNLCVSTTIIN